VQQVANLFWRKTPSPISLTKSQIFNNKKCQTVELKFAQPSVFKCHQIWLIWNVEMPANNHSDAPVEFSG